MNKTIYRDEEPPTKKDERLQAVFNTAKLSGERLNIAISGCNEFSLFCAVPNKTYGKDYYRDLEYLYLSLSKYGKWIGVFYREISSKLEQPLKDKYKKIMKRANKFWLMEHYRLKDDRDPQTGDVLGYYYQVNRKPFSEILKRFEYIDEKLRLWADQVNLLNPNQNKNDKSEAFMEL